MRRDEYFQGPGSNRKYATCDGIRENALRSKWFSKDAQARSRPMRPANETHVLHAKEATWNLGVKTASNS